jgi:hypothetical protein
MKKTIAEVSSETLRCEAVLAALKVGESVSYEMLRAAMGRDPQKDGRWLLASARRRLLREKAMVFDCIPGEGVKRLGDVEMIGHGDNVLQRIRRSARRGMNVVLSVENFVGLPENLKLKHNTTAVVLGSVAVLTGRPGQRKLAGKIMQARALTEQEVRAIAESL